MNVLAVGMSHRSAGVRELERVAISVADTAKVLDELLQCTHVNEALLLSTCNRVEIYAIVETFHGGLSDLTGVLARHAGTDPATLSPGLHVHYAAGAVEHLFAVAAGLDSMVVGDAQILGQLRTAYATADKAGTVGRALHELVQHALRVGKRVHAETDIDHVAASVVGVAVADAERVLGGLAGRRALVVGAGSMGALAATALHRVGIGEVVVANRTPVNGVRLVRVLSKEGIPSRAVGLSGLADRIGRADLVVSCTGATDIVIPTQLVTDGLACRTEVRPLVVCDLGMPRDVQASVADLAGVTLVDLESLGRRLADTPAGRHADVAAAILTDEVNAFLAAQRSAAVTPTVTALRRRAAEVVDAELLRMDSRLPDLDESVRGELAKTVRRVVDKLLHTPTVRVKELASSPGGSSYADALRELFELDPQAAAAVSTPAVTRDDSDETGTGETR